MFIRVCVYEREFNVRKHRISMNNENIKLRWDFANYTGRTSNDTHVIIFSGHRKIIGSVLHTRIGYFDTKYTIRMDLRLEQN